MEHEHDRRRPGPVPQAADVIETSRLDYTVVRPSWLTDKDETGHETTQKGEPFTGLK